MFGARVPTANPPKWQATRLGFTHTHRAFAAILAQVNLFANRLLKLSHARHQDTGHPFIHFGIPARSADVPGSTVLDKTMGDPHGFYRLVFCYVRRPTGPRVQ
jgi:hypothetical protein